MILGLLRVVYWSIRGVGVDEFHHTCARCGQTGQEHGLNRCWRFEPMRQTTWCWCPGCKADLCSQDGAIVDDSCGPEDLVWYKCTKCGQHSVWNFNHLVPFIESKEPWRAAHAEGYPRDT